MPACAKNVCLLETHVAPPSCFLAKRSMSLHRLISLLGAETLAVDTNMLQKTWIGQEFSAAII